MQLDAFELERFQSIWENRVALNVSESGVHPLEVRELLDTPALQAALSGQRLGYPQTNGTVELRTTVAAMYPGATADHVQITNGGSEANCVLLMRLVQPGDEVIVMTPNYMQIPGLARGLGATVMPWRLRETAGAGPRWTVDLDALRRMATPRTRLIALCNPNNPTGLRMEAATLDAVCDIARTVGAWVIDDEIYRGAELDGKDTPTVWGRYERAIVSSGLSKAYGLPGLRIGWIVAPPALIEELWAVHDYTTIAPGGINDFLARIALSPERRASLLARTRRMIGANYPTVRDWIASQEGLSHIPPDAGAIVFVRYEHEINSTALAVRLRDEYGVLVVPGDHFGMDGYLRIGFGSGGGHLASALERIGGCLASIGVHAR